MASYLFRFSALKLTARQRVAVRSWQQQDTLLEPPAPAFLLGVLLADVLLWIDMESVRRWLR